MESWKVELELNNLDKIVAGDDFTDDEQSRKLLTNIRNEFPELFIEGELNFDKLKEILSDSITEESKLFGLNWYGKSSAWMFARKKSLGTLSPKIEDSVDWDITRI